MQSYREPENELKQFDPVLHWRQIIALIENKEIEKARTLAKVAAIRSSCPGVLSYPLLVSCAKVGLSHAEADEILHYADVSTSYTDLSHAITDGNFSLLNFVFQRIRLMRMEERDILIHALIKNNLDAFCFLLAQGVTPNQTIVVPFCFFGSQVIEESHVLLRALNEKNTPAINMLIEYGAVVSKECMRVVTALENQQGLQAFLRVSHYLQMPVEKQEDKENFEMASLYCRRLNTDEKYALYRAFVYKEKQKPQAALLKKLFTDSVFHQIVSHHHLKSDLLRGKRF